MLRWTGGSKARASVWQGAGSSHGGGFRGTGDCGGAGRPRGRRHRHQTTPHGRHTRRSPPRNNGDSGRPFNCKGASVPSSHGSRGKRSSLSSTQDDVGRGVDCMALEWSVRAAAVAATPKPQKTSDAWTAVPCDVAVEHPEVEAHALTHDDAACLGCDYAHTHTGHPALTALEPTKEEFSCSAPGAWAESGRSPSLLMPDAGNALGTPYDFELWCPPKDEFWQVQEFAGGWKSQGHSEFASCLGLEEAPHGLLNVSVDRRTPFASLSPSPDANWASAWPDEAVTVLTYEGFPCALLNEDYDGFSAAGGGATPQTAFLATDEDVCWPPGHCDTYAGTTDSMYVHDPSNYYTSEALCVANSPPHEAPAPPPKTVPALASLLNGGHPNRGDFQLHGAEPAIPPGRAWRGRQLTWAGRGAAPSWPNGRPSHAAFAQAACAERGRGGGRRRGGAGRGRPLNLCGGLPSARYQAFQRRHRQS